MTTPRTSLLLAAFLLALAGCSREHRRFRERPSGTGDGAVTQNPDVQPGPASRDPDVTHPYLNNAWAGAEGKTLYEQWNCAGCHSPRGGGGMGPSLMDSAWIYGSDPENVFQTISQGRPQGMPAFGSRVAPPEIWKLVAYVRSLSGLNAPDARSARSDDIHASTSTPMTPRERTVRERIPPEARP
jgi:cytochrome c oxidase cbb3-type subunit III